MNRRDFILAAMAASLPTPLLAESVGVTGAGATFPNPIYQKWGEAAKAAGVATLNYQSVGSGAGVTQIKNRTVDFGASDAPVKPDDLAKASLFQFPTVIGAVVPVVNVPGVQKDQLTLTGELIADMYAGRITKWNDPKVAALNPSLNLPSIAIAPVYRADGSGTTFVWTSYLSARSGAWSSSVGASTSVKWPAGTGSRGNEGVAASVAALKGSIGYVEYAFVKQGKLAAVNLVSKSGEFVTASMAQFSKAAAAADWSGAGYVPSLIDSSVGWPITAPTYVLVPTDTDRSKAAVKFFDWCYDHGDALATELEYVPLPKSVKDSIRAKWRELKLVG